MQLVFKVKNMIFMTAFMLIMMIHCSVEVNTEPDDSNTDTPSMTAAEIVAADASSLEITYGGTDTEGGVTTDLTLPTTGANGSTITWSSDNPTVIASDGTVTSPGYGSGNATVTLTATITSGGETTTVTFVVVVLEAPPTDLYIVATDTGNLVIGYASGDSASSVTQNLTLDTTGSSGSTITWASSDTAVIAINGTVTRPAFGLGNAAVTLTATVTKNAVSDTKAFNLTVIETPQTETEAVAADLAALSITYNGSDSAGSVTLDLGLSTSGSSGTTITWSSNVTAVIAINGTVTRPAYGSGNAVVTLTATITKNVVSDTKVFNLTVIETPQTDTEAVAADLAALSITYNGSDSAGSVTLNVGLSTAGSNGSTITWASSNTAVVAINGSVTRPAYGLGNAAVTLTATISKNSASDTKAFNLTVLEGNAGDQITYTAGVSFNMRFVPGKTTFTGTTDATQTTVTNDYLIAETEVTYQLWSAVYTWATSNGYTFANAGTMGDGTGDTNQHPVTTINWRDAMVWTNALTEYYNAQNGTSYAPVYTSDSAYTTPIRSSADGAYGASVNYPNPGSFDDPYVNPNAKGFRLPTDAEWELAARYKSDANSDGDIIDAGEYYPGSYASGATAAYNNATATGLVSWHSVNSGSSTHPVATKTGNALGLYDMSGNVWEWNFDWYTVGTVLRIGRGGSWFDTEGALRVGYVYDIFPFNEFFSIGFRPARSP